MIYLDTSALVKKYVIEEGTDAVHLSSALWVGNEIGLSLRFVASDRVLLKAAVKEGLEVMKPGKG